MATFKDFHARLARAGQDHGLFDVGQGLEFPTTSSTVAARAHASGRDPDVGVAITRDRAVSVWEELSGHVGISLLEEDRLRTMLARHVRLAADLGLVTSEEVAIGIGLDHIEMLGVANGPTSTSLPFLGRSGPIRIEPTESMPTRALAAAAAEIADELVARMLLALHDNA